MRFSSKMHDGIMVGHDALQKLCIAYVAHNELYAIRRKPRYVLGVARIGELVEHGHAHLRVFPHDVAHEVRPDEAAAAGDDDALRSEVRHAKPPL